MFLDWKKKIKQSQYLKDIINNLKKSDGQKV